MDDNDFLTTEQRILVWLQPIIKHWKWFWLWGGLVTSVFFFFCSVNLGKHQVVSRLLILLLMTLSISGGLVVDVFRFAMVWSTLNILGSLVFAFFIAVIMGPTVGSNGIQVILFFGLLIGAAIWLSHLILCIVVSVRAVRAVRAHKNTP